MWITHVRGSHQSFKDGLLLAESTCQGQSRSILKADGIRYLRLQWEDVRILLVAPARVIDLVLADIKTQTFCEPNSIGPGDWSTKTFNGREDLLQEVKFDIRLETVIGFHDILKRV
jgi:hypothetical protein